MRYTRFVALLTALAGAQSSHAMQLNLLHDMAAVLPTFGLQCDAGEQHYWQYGGAVASAASLPDCDEVNANSSPGYIFNRRYGTLEQFVATAESTCDGSKYGNTIQWGELYEVPPNGIEARLRVTINGSNFDVGASFIPHCTEGYFVKVEQPAPPGCDTPTCVDRSHRVRATSFEPKPTIDPATAA